MNTRKDLNVLKMLMESADQGLRGIARLKDDRRKAAIRLAFADFGRAQELFVDGRVSNVGSARDALCVGRAKLAEALDKRTGVAARAEIITDVHRRVLAGLADVKKALAECREEVAA